MIHHLSIPANNPRHVAEVLAKIWNGQAAPFPPHSGSYMAIAHDEYGTMIEVHPFGTELIPGMGEQPAQFQVSEYLSPYSPVHAAISVPLSQEKIEEIAAQEGWRALRCHRGNFDVIEFWIENHLMLELLTPEMATQYLQFSQKRSLEQFLTQAG
ncbi:MAG TPA: hypothetical protein VK203_08285 [Nostocaceae cyanobacterium]|nr:hypothetical protein [Nostocaceae cyanobacterium]